MRCEGGKLQWDTYERKTNKKNTISIVEHILTKIEGKRESAISHTEYVYKHKLFSHFLNNESNI